MTNFNATAERPAGLEPEPILDEAAGLEPEPILDEAAGLEPEPILDEAAGLAPEPILDAGRPARLRLGAWNYYFIVKLALFWRELIGFHPLENLAFAAFLLAPVGPPRWRRAKALLAAPLGAALLYYDSWLPALSRVASQTGLLANFGAGYLLELGARFISWPLVAALVLGWLLYRVVAFYLRVGVLTLAALLALALWRPAE
ncbi:MAG: cellulose biosynthesis protein BcsG, partial [Burkholderiaceae bacterium]|nr:cellulose biosynthesis protein BcsG [Burkholderiaceae bacterium]